MSQDVESICRAVAQGEQMLVPVRWRAELPGRVEAIKLRLVQNSDVPGVPLVPRPAGACCRGALDDR